MGCGCKGGSGGGSGSARVANTPKFKVKLPDGTVETFTNEPDARLKAAKTGGRFSRMA